MKVLIYNLLERNYKIWWLINLAPMEEGGIKMMGRRERNFLSVLHIQGEKINIPSSLCLCGFCLIISDLP